MWRTISLVIISFWLVMTTQLVRFVWFPEGSQFAEVPPDVVLKRFLEQSSGVDNAGTLWIYHREKKIGFANIRCTRIRSDAQDYKLHLEGFLEKGSLSFTPEKVMWRIALNLQDVNRLGGFTAFMRVERSPWMVSVVWQRGQQIPLVQVRAPEDSGINDAAVQLLAAQAFGGGALPGLPADVAAAAEAGGDDSVKLRARQGQMDFAGQKSLGHNLELTLMNQWKVRAFITEAGELVHLTLPDGYRLIDPVIHGLIPDYDEDDEEDLPEAGNTDAASRK